MRRDAFTTKDRTKGTGLGLSTVHRSVQQADGFIEVHTELGTGTTFDIYLPASDRPIEEKPGEYKKRRSVRPPEDSSQTILLVEDDEAVLQLARGILERHGYVVITASDAEQALAVWKTRSQPADLLLTDLVLPGQDGCELSEQITAMAPELPVLYMTGYSEQREVVGTAREAPAAGHETVHHGATARAGPTEPRPSQPSPATRGKKASLSLRPPRDRLAITP